MTNWQMFLPLLYPLITAIASLIYPVLDKNKYAHAFFSFLAALGIDLPKVWSAVVRMLPGVAGAGARAAMKLLPFVALASVARAAVRLLVLFVALVALALSVGACLSAAQVKSLTDASGGLCQVVVQASDPALAPLCVPAQMLAEAIEALVGQAGDAGVGAPPPSQDAIYAWCAAHGAKPVAQ